MSVSVDGFWAAKVAEWRKLYSLPITRPVYNDPTRTRICCLRCGSTRKISRHHKGNDFWFACLRPNLYAAEYVQFRPSQVANLCENCHRLVHKNYKKMMIQVKADLYNELMQTGLSIPRKEWCDKWLNEFRNWFEVWVKKPKRKRKRQKK